ncbi:MAG: MBG domain-containing protein, partial [Bacteroidota bacterium]|nr:MBG domain-containing protein [Bacteroidota bacterium]
SFPNWDFLNESANGTDDIWGFYPSLYNGYPCFVWQLLPEVSTDSISHVDKNSAVVHAHIKLGLNRTQDAYGVCWNTTGNPTVADPKTNNGYFSENRAYADTVRSLKGNVTYYARAYATGTYGTVYGKEMSFTTILHPLAINPPQVELTKIYDGTASAQITSMGTISGIKNNDDIRVSATANYDNANVAKDKTLIITYTLSGSAGNFYDAPVNDTIYNGEITARPIKVTVDPDQTKVYGEPDPVFLYSYSPELINGDVFKGALSRVAGENVGNYMIEKGSLSAGDNYHVDFIPGNFTITRKLLTCNSLIITDSKVYDGTTAVAFTPGPVTGIKAGDEVLFTATANYDNKDVGPNKNIAITYNLSGSQSDNYSIRQPEKAAGIITPAPLIITPNNIEKRIGQTYTFSGTEFSTKGLLSVDTVYSVILHSMGAEASAPLNEYDIVIDDVIGKGLNNYSLDYEQGTLTVKDKISPLITWISPKNITYGTELSNVQLNAIVIDNGTILEGLYTYNPPAGTVLNAGTGQALNVSFMPVDLINYSTANRSVNINVDKAILTASTGIYTIKEGDGLPDFLITYSGFVNCDNIGAIDVKPTAVTSYNGTGSGDYDVIVGNGSDNNYDFKYENGELVVFPKTDLEKKGLILYPNPCGNEFNINAGDSLSVLYMYDLTGKLVLT